MILLDLEYVIHLISEDMKENQVYIPGSLISINTHVILVQNIPYQNSIFYKLLINDSIDPILTYKEADQKLILSNFRTNKKLFVPDQTGENILNLTDNDIRYIISDRSIDPDSEFLKIHKDVYSVQNPQTMLGKIFKLILSYQQLKQLMNQNISSLE